MRYRTFVSMKVALICMSDNAEAYAMRYANAEHEVLIAWKDSDNMKVSPELTTYNNIRVCSIEEAAESADFIIIATSPKHVREVAYWLGDVRNKVIVDATANFHNNIEEQVNTFSAIKAITGSFHVVKVFSTKGYEQLLAPLFGHTNTQVIMTGDSKKAKGIAKIIAEDLGVNTFFDMGSSDAIPLFNELTSGWCKLAQVKDKTLIAVNPVKI